jgi:hypothetical protein
VSLVRANLAGLHRKAGLKQRERKRMMISARCIGNHITEKQKETITIN